MMKIMVFEDFLNMVYIIGLRTKENSTERWKETLSFFLATILVAIMGVKFGVFSA